MKRDILVLNCDIPHARWTSMNLLKKQTYHSCKKCAKYEIQYPWNWRLCNRQISVHFHEYPWKPHFFFKKVFIVFLFRFPTFSMPGSYLKVRNVSIHKGTRRVDDLFVQDVFRTYLYCIFLSLNMIVTNIKHNRMRTFLL